MERVEGEVAIDIREALLSSASQNLDALSDEPMAADNFTFFRVPAHIRERNKLLFKPRMVAIGPYGRSDEPSLRAMEQLKRRYLQSFCSRSVTNMSIDVYKAEIQELEPRARQCYFERVELSTEKFVEMLLVDGCFILEFLIKWYAKDKDDMFAAEWSLPLIRGDLLLLENQIPLFVLEKLFELVAPTVDSMIPSSLKELLVEYLTAMNVESPKESSKEGTQANRGPCDNAPPEAKIIHHLLHLYYYRYVKKPQTYTSDSCEKRLPRTIPSATKLLEAGVTIKRKEEEEKKKNRNQNKNQTSLSSFLDVTFSNGVLEIPFLSVENSTLPRFSNLVAFEQCGGCKPKDAYMTSYAVFMNCLINTREDVAILHKLGILENKLASDKELAVFFNQLSDWASLDYKKHYLAKLFQEVEEYCGTPWPSWRAKLVSDYFSNPWAIISVIAAAVLLILTIVQTVYTIYS